MVKRRASLTEIGDALGVTRERARQLIVRITEEHGDVIFASDETIWTPQEAADELGLNAQTVCRLCQSGEVPTKRRGVNDDGGYLIYEQGMRILRAHPLVTRERKCVICKQTFTYGNHQGRQRICSDECKAQYYRQRRKAYGEQESTLKSLRGWRRDLWQKLQSHHIPKNEEWLTISEAIRRTGLSKMQLVWLRLRKIVTIRPHPANKCRGQPVAAYAASEMKIARQVCKTHTNRNNKHL